MFQSIEPLSKSKHKELKIQPVKSFDFARNLTSVPLSYREILKASRYYPIVFSANEAPTPLALLSVNKEGNAFIDSDGNWTASYIPLHIRRYPFILGQTDQEDSFVVCIDPEAPHFSTDQGEPLYTEEGEGTDMLNRATEYLKQFHQEMVTTQQMFQALDGKEIFREKRMTIGRGDKQEAAISGFKTVDTKVLNGLDNETLGTWVKQGIMGLVYAHLHSFDNIKAMA